MVSHLRHGPRSIARRGPDTARVGTPPGEGTTAGAVAVGWRRCTGARTDHPYSKDE